LQADKFSIVYSEEDDTEWSSSSSDDSNVQIKTHDHNKNIHITSLSNTRSRPTECVQKHLTGRYKSPPVQRHVMFSPLVKGKIEQSIFR
jgi:hypothetical protein